MISLTFTRRLVAIMSFAVVGLCVSVPTTHAATLQDLASAMQDLNQRLATYIDEADDTSLLGRVKGINVSIPNAQTTGVQPGVTLGTCNGGSNVITRSGTYENCRFNGDVYIDTDNVTIRNSFINQGTVKLSSGDFNTIYQNVLLDHVEIDGGANNFEFGTKVSGITCTNCKVHNVAVCWHGKGMHIEDSYCYDLNGQGDPQGSGTHNETIVAYGAAPTVIKNNNLVANWSQSSTGGGMSAVVALYGHGFFGEIDNVTLEGNRLQNTAGAWYCLYTNQTANGPTNMTIKDNVFIRQGGALNRGCDRITFDWVKGSRNSWTGNVYDDGTPIPDPDTGGNASITTVDTDGDGVIDGADNCALTSNPNQTDSNRDGVGDACVNNPNPPTTNPPTTNPPTTDPNPPATPADTDNDGVADSSDNCVAVRNASQADTDSDGVGDACDSTPNGDLGGGRVETTDRINVRGTPNGSVDGVVPVGTTGTQSVLAPVGAGGFSWVFVAFDTGLSGYVAERYLVPEGATPVPPPTQPPTSAPIVRIETIDRINVRATPNGTILGAQGVGVQGDQPDVAAVDTGGYGWVFVDFDTGSDGYVATDFIILAPTAPTPVPVPTPDPTPTPVPVPTPDPTPTPVPDPGTGEVSDAAALQNAISGAQSGDVIEVASGNFGALTITKSNNRDVTIKAAAGATPVFKQIEVSGNNWILDGLRVEPDRGVTAVNINGDSNTIRNSYVTFGDSSNWSANAWLSNAGDGITFNGANTLVENNYLKNVAFGINGLYDADNSVVRANTVDGYRGDGMRGLADNMLYENNLVKNAYKVDGNHDDGFQSWSFANGTPGAGVVRGLTLRGNTFINNEDPNQPMPATIQGIGLFDGIFEDLLIEDNIVVADHWHGIAVYGADNVTVRNNTVVDPTSATPGPAWIKITNHKDGRSPVKSVVENNIANVLDNESAVTERNNALVSYDQYNQWFRDVANNDYRLVSNPPQRGVGADATGSPTPDPVPVPTPDPTPVPVPVPTPDPTPTPDPVPTPDPTPVPDPEPTPDPTPVPDPEPTPDPTPVPDPEPTPDPTPVPDPEPTPDPEPEDDRVTYVAVRDLINYYEEVLDLIDEADTHLDRTPYRGNATEDAEVALIGGIDLVEDAVSAYYRLEFVYAWELLEEAETSVKRVFTLLN